MINYIHTKSLGLYYAKFYKRNFADTFLIFLVGLIGLVACQSPTPLKDNQPTVTIQPVETVGETTEVTIMPSATAEATLTPKPSFESESEITQTPDFTELTVSSNLPDAQVSIDGNQVGFTPYQTFLSIGRGYLVTVTLPGFHSFDQLVTPLSGEPVELDVDFSFSPQIEELVDCVSDAWWEEEGQAIYFVKCPSFNDSQGGLWQLDLATRTIEQVGDTPFRPRVSINLLPLIPDSVQDIFVHISPSGNRVVYLEQLDPHHNQSTPTPAADPADVGELPIRFEYLVYYINENGEKISLGQIEGTPFEISWSEDEQSVFMATTIMDGDVPGGWLADFEKLTLQEMVPPTFDGSVASSHFCFPSLQPNGEAIMYRPCFSESDSPFLLWNYQSGDIQEIENYGPNYIWLAQSRYLLFSDGEALVWYDINTDATMRIIEDAKVFFGPGQNFQYLSPQGDKIIFPRIRANGPRGLWLLILDVD